MTKMASLPSQVLKFLIMQISYETFTVRRLGANLTNFFCYPADGGKTWYRVFGKECSNNSQRFAQHDPQ